MNRNGVERVSKASSHRTWCRCLYCTVPNTDQNVEFTIVTDHYALLHYYSAKDAVDISLSHAFDIAAKERAKLDKPNKN